MLAVVAFSIAWRFLGFVLIGALVRSAWRGAHRRATRRDDAVLFAFGLYIALDNASRGDLARTATGLAIAIAGAYLIHTTSTREPAP